MELSELGFDSWFRRQWESMESSDEVVARVSAVNRDNYTILGERGEAQAELTGKILYTAESKVEMPTVGDWVLVQYFNDDTLAIIQNILPRKTVLKRKIAGKTVDFQLLAANIDTAFIMQSLDGNFNLRRLERYLVMIRDGGIQPVILLSKCDLIENTDLDEKLDIIRKMDYGCEAAAFSNVDGKGLKAIQSNLESGHTYCLLGSSGVGKTTLLNRLIGEDRFTVAEVRKKDSKGKHTTTARQLIQLPSGGLIIDTPGMRELGLFGVESGLDDTFGEIGALAQNCRYKDCTHTHEAGCAVREAVGVGRLDAGIYESYIKIRKESEHYNRSYLEKKRRDKEFGKMVKQYKKIIRKNEP